MLLCNVHREELSKDGLQFNRALVPAKPHSTSLKSADLNFPNEMQNKATILDVTMIVDGESIVELNASCCLLTRDQDPIDPIWGNRMSLNLHAPRCFRKVNFS